MDKTDTAGSVRYCMSFRSDKVWENLTCRLPMFNPRYILQHLWPSGTLNTSMSLPLTRLSESEYPSSDLLLSDFNQFCDLQTMHLDYYIAAEAGWVSMANISGLQAKPPTRKQNEACWNWNKRVCGWEKKKLLSPHMQIMSQKRTHQW